MMNSFLVFPKIKNKTSSLTEIVNDFLPKLKDVKCVFRNLPHYFLELVNIFHYKKANKGAYETAMWAIEAECLDENKPWSKFNHIFATNK